MLLCRSKVPKFSLFHFNHVNTEFEPWPPVGCPFHIVPKSLGSATYMKELLNTIVMNQHEWTISIAAMGILLAKSACGSHSFT